MRCLRAKGMTESSTSSSTDKDARSEFGMIRLWFNRIMGIVIGAITVILGVLFIVWITSSFSTWLRSII